MADNYQPVSAGHITFTSVTYKPQSTMIEESQQLELAAELANKGYTITIKERPEVIEQVKVLYGDLFNYETRD